MEDFINTLFQFFGSAAAMSNILKIRKDKQVKGISVWASLFFSMWGLWSLYYYNASEHSINFYYFALLSLLNIIWLVMAFYYKLTKKTNTQDSTQDSTQDWD
ncbi:MAG: hypothetical protein NTY74_14755 [Ignavibacteriae bacterium]|nr:hypothetical protein [Ignavibacteriota bacterium]